MQRTKPKKTNYRRTERFQDVETLLQRLENETPAPGEYLYDYKLQAVGPKLENLNSEELKKYKINFPDLPMSSKTIDGLSKRRFFKMTEIQRCVIPHALAGRDIMAASRTGSGKTLSYLIPIIERLYTSKWTVLDGLGALIILPTRELAIQVFEVFTSITPFHDLSVGLIIGGKNLKFEQTHISTMNVLICTPGRLLQHMEETPGFNSDNLKLLVLDEADLILEMGFRNTVRTILGNLPIEKQTLLFSATLGKNVHELGRVTLKMPEMIFLNVPNASSEVSSGQSLSSLYETPNKMEQYYMIVNLEDKLDCLFSFLKSHQKHKILVFLSTCKQVRFTFEALRKLRIGVPIMELHGRQKQPKRMAIFFTFSEKKHAVLFTTNIAARGLDFPSVDWIVQVDCPEDKVTYVHRVGRTARYKSGGKALLFLRKEEEGFLKEGGLNLKKIESNPNKAMTIKSTLQAFCSESIDLKYLAQRAFISYMRFLYLAPNKTIFDVHKVDTDSFAESLGLIQTPVIKFKKIEETGQGQEEEVKKKGLQKLKEKIKANKLKKMQNNLAATNEETNVQNEAEETQPNSSKSELSELLINKKREQSKLTKQEKMKSRKNIDVLSTRFEKLREQPSNLEEEEFLVPKIRQEGEEEEVGGKRKLPPLVVSKRKLKKIKLDGHFEGRNKLKFDDEGNALTLEELRLQEYASNLQKLEHERKDLTKDYSRKLIVNKEEDDQREKDRRKVKREKRKRREAEWEMERKGVEEEEAVVIL